MQYLTVRMKLTHRQIFEETDVVLGMPIQSIYHFVPMACLWKPIDRFHHLRRFLSITAFSKSQYAIDKVILYVDYH